ncbi:hypothetical protein [Kitasatospora cheerisanensis]|uniref:hypothetical protein n=1 Tax=Kitasatospora cheerisanensis TaxID=81942 RepID=UPI0024484436|nr:hypothetical protein [Kitasatospora cheerisanensis]
MTRGMISRQSVLRAIEEFDELGRELFLDRYGFGRARDYLLVHEGRRYDSKAVAGVAHKYEYGRALTSGEFSGGLHAAVRWLRRAGFQVASPQRVDWSWDELLLTCAAVAAGGWHPVPAGGPAAAELSALLRTLPVPADVLRDDALRTPAEVARKSRDLAALRDGPAADAAATGRRSSGSSGRSWPARWRWPPRRSCSGPAWPPGRSPGSRRRAPRTRSSTPPRAGCCSVSTSSGSGTAPCAARRSTPYSRPAAPWPARSAPSTSPSGTANAARATSSATTWFRCTSRARAAPGSPTWR